MCETSSAVTLEQALVPFLFPFGTGAYDGSVDFREYIRMCFSAAFSPFTLYVPYLLFMYQLRQCKIIATACNRVCLEKDLFNLRRQHPEFSDQALYREVIKHSIPGKVAGSPSWFMSQYKDLLCMVDHFGLPDIFLTVTADEVSESRWAEVNDLCDLLRRIKLNLDWTDAPVESARLSHERLTNFMNGYVLGGPAVLGRVLHSVIRYEVQSRGSVHAHIILWLDKRDVQRVTNEIVACIPAVLNSSGEFNRPEEPMHARLFDLVRRKQMHVCRPDACLRYGKCKSDFPFDPHFDDAVLDPVSNRWKYFRPGPEHRKVVFYHPILLFLLNNHMNIQRVTETNWSGYMLKYALKAEPSGELILDSRLAARLGIKGLSEQQLKLLSGTVLSKPVSLCEAALACLQIPIVQRSESVVTDYIHFHSSKPTSRHFNLLN